MKFKFNSKSMTGAVSAFLTVLVALNLNISPQLATAITGFVAAFAVLFDPNHASDTVADPELNNPEH
jgi:hypothetical protein